MAEARGKPRTEVPRRLPRGRHALSPEEVRADQRRRLLEAVPAVVAERGYEAMSVADIVRAAAVSRNAFYENFGDKEECFAAAHEACQERLLDAVRRPCDRRASAEERVEAALGRAFDLLGAEPATARLVFIEAPAAGEVIARRYHQWLRRYGTLLRSSIPEAADRSSLAVEMDQVIVGGLASRIASEVLEGRAAKLRSLTPHALDYVLAFYRSGPLETTRAPAPKPEIPLPAVSSRARRARS